MSSQDQAQVFGGHTAKIIYDGKELGFFFDVSYSIDYGLQDVGVLGQTTVVEHQQTRYAVSGDARRYMIRDEIVNGKGLAPLSAAEAIRQDSFDLDIIDKISGKVVIRLESVTLASSSAAMATGQLTSQRISFRAINTRAGASEG